MFVITRDVSAAKKVIATLLATALVLWASGAFNTARAANITDVSDLLTDSSPSSDSNHTISFISPTGVGAGETIVITFPSIPDSFDLTGLTEDDVDLEIDGVDENTAPAAASGIWGVAFSGGDTLTITSNDTVIPAGSSTVIKIGDNATTDGTGANLINNPATSNTSYEIRISAGTDDSGYTRVAIVDTVLVTANVQTTFDFVVYGNATTTLVNGTTTTNAASSTAIPFGTLQAGQIKTIAQDLTVGTNAINGFVVTVESDGPFESSTGADIDNFVDGIISPTLDPVPWAQPTNNIALENTWGHWGVTSEDTDTVSNRSIEFGNNEWIGVGTSSAPTVLFAHDGPADSVTPGIGSTTVGYQIEITPLQEAGDDYNTTLTYIATPTF